MLIGLCGPAGAGKDTLADMLVAGNDFHKYSLAGPMKEMLNKRFGWKMSDWDDRVWKETPGPGCGWDEETGNYHSPRTWAQWLGTEVGRKLAGPDVWALMMQDEWYRRLRTPNFHGMVVPDVRFDNEARTIENLGGAIIRLDSKRALSVALHVSEAGVSSHYINYRFLNDGTPYDLYSAVRTALRL